MEGWVVLLILLVIAVPIALLVAIVTARNHLGKVASDLQMELAGLRSQLGDIRRLLTHAAPVSEERRDSAPAPEPEPEEETLAAAREPAAVEKSIPPQPAPPPEEPPPLPPSATPPQPEPAPSPQVFEPAAPPPKFVQETGAILRRIWNWVLVGEEHRPKFLPTEHAVAITWLIRAGALVVFVGVLMLLRELHAWLPPTGKVALTTVLGALLFGGGIRVLRTPYHVLGQAFVGLGLATLYASMYALGPRYGLLELPYVFALMALVTVVAGVLSVTFDSQITAVLAILGGFITPAVLSTGEPRLLVLYAYMLLLNLGILGIAHARQWRVLNYLTFLGTWTLLSGSLSAYDRTVHFPVVISFFTVFFLLHSAIVYYYNVLRRIPASVLEVIYLLANVGVYATTAHWILDDALGRPWPALMSVGVAAVYIAHVYVFLKRRQGDRRLLIAFLAIGAFFTVWTMPLVFEKATLTFAWACQALLLLWLGYKLGSTALKVFAQVMYALVLFRVITWDLHRGFGTTDWQDLPVSAYLGALWEHVWTFGSVVVSLLLGHRIQTREVAPFGSFVVPGTGERRPVPSWAVRLREVAYWCGVVLFFVVLYRSAVPCSATPLRFSRQS